MKKAISIVLCFCMIAVGCLTPGKAFAAASDTLTIAYSPFSGVFSPFFADSSYDKDVVGMTQVSLFSSDRTGAIIFNGIQGETIAYNGTNYTYYGPADMTVTENADGTVDYGITLKRNLKFSDGTPMTIDDVIFSMYVLCDPTYDGPSNLQHQPITGLDDYRRGIETLMDLIYYYGRDNTDYSYFTAEQQTAFWAKYDAAVLALAQEIVEYCISEYSEYGAVDVQTAAELWGYDVPDNTLEGFAAVLEGAYESDFSNMVKTEGVDSSADDLFPDLKEYTGIGIQTGTSAPNISGIEKTGAYSMIVHMDEVDATSIYHLAISIAPLHYYGDTSLYDYDNNQFGFPKGNLSIVRSRNTQPIGAGPYKFIRFENGVVSFEANNTYYQGAPKTKYLGFKEYITDEDMLDGLITGVVDIASPNFSTQTVQTILNVNGGELSGPMIQTNTINNLGYGYIGISADLVNVGGVENKASDASKALRKAFGTVFSFYREDAVASYYGDRAVIINYPISDSSWAAPRVGDPGYRTAFSTDVNGNDIFTAGMSASKKHKAVKQAALGFFEAAGYTIENSKCVAAPEGASLEYEVVIPGEGIGAHPSLSLMNNANRMLSEIGISIVIRDPSNSSDMWSGLEEGSIAMWCAAWGSTADPDMYQIYYSDVANGGQDAGGSNYMYHIADPNLDQLILDARKSTNRTYRKSIYRQCLDIILDWAVEIPVYQRQNAVLFSAERVDLTSIPADNTPFYGWGKEVQNIKTVLPANSETAVMGKHDEITYRVDKARKTVVIVAPEGDVMEDAPVLVASYDSNGRFLGLDIVTVSRSISEAAEQAAEISLFWVDENAAPLCDHAEIPLD